MLLVLARIVVSLVLFSAPFLAFIFMSGAPETAIILIFPMMGAIPAVIAALLLFVPAEWLCDRIGAPWFKNVVVPMLGAGLIFVVDAAFALYDPQYRPILGKLAGGSGALTGLVFWAALGAGWGVVWRMTDWIARRLGMMRARPLFAAA